MRSLIFESLTTLEATRRMHATVFRVINRVKDAAGKEPLEQSERVDLAFLMRELSELCDDLRKESNKARELLDNVMCAVWAKEFEEHPETGPIRGTLATATPKVRFGVTLPSKSKDPERYEEFMRWLEIPQELIDAGVVSTHWPRMTEWLTERAKEGRPMPAGIDVESTYPVYSTTLRRKPDADLRAVSLRDVRSWIGRDAKIRFRDGSDMEGVIVHAPNERRVVVDDGEDLFVLELHDICEIGTID